MRPDPALTIYFDQCFQAFMDESLSPRDPLHQVMRYALSGSGKRLRPLFCLETADWLSLPLAHALPCALALEVVHQFSLVHDDLPCMDDDDFRRGEPTSHRIYGESKALLAGDALLNRAHHLFAKSLSYTSPDAFFRAHECFSKAVESMIRGQTEELDHPSTLDSLLYIQALKTGALFRASIECILHLAGENEESERFQDAMDFSERFGFAFQIADDLEDFEQDQLQPSKNILSMMGKKAAIDLAIKKLTESKVTPRFSASRLLISKLEQHR